MSSRAFFCLCAICAMACDRPEGPDEPLESQSAQAVASAQPQRLRHAQTLEVTSSKASLKDEGPGSLLGKAIVVHRTDGDPTDASGVLRGPLACGVIQEGRSVTQPAGGGIR